MRKSVTAIALSAALLMTGAQAAEAAGAPAAKAGVSASTTAGARKVIKTSTVSRSITTKVSGKSVSVTYRTAAGKVVTIAARKVIKTAGKPTKTVIKTSHRR